MYKNDGIMGVIPKVTEGITYADPQFGNYVKQLCNQSPFILGSYLTGVYHMLVAEDNGIQQAIWAMNVTRNAVVSACNPQKNEQPFIVRLFVDVEDRQGSNAPASKYYQPTVDFLNYVYEYGSTKYRYVLFHRGVYTYKSWFDSVCDKKCCEKEKSDIITGSYLWLSRPNVENPELPYCWRDWLIWQYKVDVKVDGVKGAVDLSCGQAVPVLYSNTK